MPSKIKQQFINIILNGDTTPWKRKALEDLEPWELSYVWQMQQVANVKRRFEDE